MKWFRNVASRIPAIPYSSKVNEIPTRDPRWDGLPQDTTKCRCCSQNINTLLSFAYTSPQMWPGGMSQHANSSYQGTGNDILCEDFCRIGETNFVRAILCLPLEGYDVPFIIGVWVALEGEYFERYIHSFGTSTQADIGPLFGWMANAIAEHPVPLPVILHPQNGRQRPLVQIAFEEHPLYIAQLDGLTYDQFEGILTGAGHKLEIAEQDP